MKSINKSLLFLFLTFIINWSIAAIYYFNGGTLTSERSMLFITGYMCVPLITAFIVQKVIWKDDVVIPFKISFRFNVWYIIAWLLPLALVLITFGAALLFPGITFSTGMEYFYDVYMQNVPADTVAQIRTSMNVFPVHPFWITIIEGLLTGGTVYALVSFGEEFAWRGFLLNEWKDKGPFNASLLIGIVWGIWHAPLILMGFNYQQHPVAGIFMMTFICILLSPIFTFITLRSGSIIATSIFHGTLKALLTVSFILLKGGSDLTVGVYGLAGVAGILLVLSLIMDYDKLFNTQKIYEQESNEPAIND